MKQITISAYLYYSLIIAIFLISVIFYFAMKDGSQCIGNPFTYGAESLESEATGDLLCTCTFSEPRYSPFLFNSEDVWALRGVDINKNFTSG